MYRVWYWMGGELYMVSCGNNADYARRLVEGYYDLHRYPYLEYIERKRYARSI